MTMIARIVAGALLLAAAPQPVANRPADVYAAVVSSVRAISAA